MTRTKTMRPKRTVRRTSKVQRRRLNVYGPISHDTIVAFTESSFVTGGSTTPYGWLYGRDSNITSTSLDEFISNQHGELRINKIVISCEAFLAPSDLSINLSGNTKMSDGKPTASVALGGTIRGQDIACFGILIMDGERASEPVKFRSVADFRGHPAARSKLFSEGKICTLRSTWVPTEPSDREWVSRINNHTYLRILFLGTNCADNVWVSPDIGSHNSRKFIFQTRITYHVSLRGKKTNVAYFRPTSDSSSPSTPDLSQWTIT